MAAGEGGHVISKKLQHALDWAFFIGVLTIAATLIGSFLLGAALIINWLLT